MRKRTGGLLGALTLTLALFSASAPAQAQGYLQCVPFARMFSGIQIFGDAWTWWGQAAGKYEQGFNPKSGAVLVFRQHGPMVRGHVAVVSKVLTDRVIQISHANWSRINGTRGQIERDVTVIDVSSDGDWSQVKVWYDPLKDIGTSTYPTYGFIYQDQKALTLASAQTTAKSFGDGVGAAVTRVASVVSPSAIADAATDSVDRIAALLQGGQTETYAAN